MSLDYSRKQSVVFFSDIVGYTRLMGKDEDRAFALMRQNLQIHQEVLSNYRGRIIKELGDGILAVFETVPEALSASLEIQRQQSLIPDMAIRIGLHFGDIIFDKGDVFGDAVNLAARIQGIGVPNCMLISEQVKDHIPSDSQFHTSRLGPFRLKNVDHPVELFAVTNPPLAVPKRTEIIKNIQYQEKNPWKFWAVLGVTAFVLLYLIYSVFWNNAIWEKEKSVAILPFVNSSENPDQEFFSEGLTEDVISQVSKIGSIKVISEDAVQEFKNSNSPLDSIAKVLDVSTILKGSVQWMGDKIRINVQLIDPEENKNLWAETYNREVTEIFKVQEEIATEIARVLNSSLSAEERSQLSKTQTSSFEAYELHLKGRELYSNYNKQSVLEAIDYFKAALKEDPNYALAYASLADCYAQLNYFGEGDQWQDSSLEMSAKALAIDPYLAEGFKSQGNVYYYRGQNEYAKISFEKALVLNPNLSSAIGNLATVYFVSGNLTEALQLQKKSVSLNPTNFIPYQISGWIYRVLDQFDEANDWLDRSYSVQKDPITIEQKAFIEIEKGNLSQALSFIDSLFVGKKDTTALDFSTAGTIAFFSEDWDAAKELLVKSTEKTPEFEQDEYFTSPILLSFIYQNEKNYQKAKSTWEQAIRIRENAVDEFGDDFNLYLDLAQLEAIRGNQSQSLDYLMLAEEKGLRDDFYILNNPIFKNYLKDPRTLSVLNKINKERIKTNQELESNDLQRSR
ncbi:adenylate/guanylate cyclase domain-containing protein [Algoriphagus kandeliae]|uniref:Adenylate/guanylate cyclase domain-containing protein n=1 Tax=Algoriphagus kandeliae TaxID=2562278 RepID=A0A4Y9QXW5_9BACT|nr:adenylate/guanylate cyclase domain-containing protein [Algoriphagus kandeliae]TFV97311.1 adenylate/guanylate cyclase domain-containing protein [Algoriphagus kandeliae]